MDFWAYVKQETRGCDYTIGCGNALWAIKADSWDDAVESLRRDITGIPGNDDHIGYWDNRIGYASLAQVIRVESMSVQGWYRESEAEREEIERQTMEAKERYLYERLRYKFEPVLSDEDEEAEERRLYERLRQKYEEGER